MAPNVEFSGVPAGQARHCAAQPAATVVERADSATGVVECGSLNVSNNEALRAATEAVLSALDKTPVQNMTLEVHDRREALRAALAQPAASGEQAADLREKLTDAIAAGLHGTYHCTRVWSAWQVGTMSEDDFEPVDESDTPAEIAAAVLALMPATAQPAPARVPLTGAEIASMQRSANTTGVQFLQPSTVRWIVRAIEAAHGITAQGEPK